MKLEDVTAELEGMSPRDREKRLTAMLQAGGSEAAAARFFLQHERRQKHESPADKAVVAPQTK